MSLATVLSASRRAAREVRDFFLVPPPSAALPGGDERAKAYYGAALRRRNAARRLLDADPGTALHLYREAAWLLIAAALAPSDHPEGERDVRQLDMLRAALGARQIAIIPELGKLERVLLSHDALELDGLFRDAADETARDLSSLCEWLAGLVKPPSAAERRLRRAQRRLLPVALVLGLSSLAVYQSTRPPNLALRGTASASSRAFNTHPQRALDDIQYGLQLGFHSAVEKQPWWMVDLGAEHRLTSIVAYGRGDCCYDQSVPLLVETSLDGKRFRVLARRDAPFSQTFPWKVDAEQVRARYVRFRTLRESVLVLSEVEVFGR